MASLDKYFCQEVTVVFLTGQITKTHPGLVMRNIAALGSATQVDNYQGRPQYQAIRAIDGITNEYVLRLYKKIS